MCHAGQKPVNQIKKVKAKFQGGGKVGKTFLAMAKRQATKWAILIKLEK